MSYLIWSRCRGSALQDNNGSEAGFTLLELILVCALISLILTVSIPTLRSSLYTNELKSTARKIIGTVKELRNLSISEQQAYLLHCDVDKNYIWYELDDGKELPDEKPLGEMQFPEDVRLDDVQAHSQSNKNFGVMTLWINKRGYMDQTVLHLSDGDGATLSLFFSPFSGSARVYEEYIEID